jgi:hypothetical protein
VRQEVSFTWELAIKLALEAAKAVNALHCWKPCIVHRDLKVLCTHAHTARTARAHTRHTAHG